MKKKQSDRNGATPSRARAVRAVFERDADYNGVFVYAVKTTGVYCLPACPSRRPKPENIEVFTTGVAARGAGYRACRRCRPDEYARTSRIESAVWSVMDYIEENLEEQLTLDELAGEVGLSPFYLQRGFKEILGLTPKQYVEKKRMQVLKSRLRAGDDVLDATLEAGFTSLREPYEKAKRHLGMTPGQYRKGGKDLEIIYTIVSSALGRILIAATGSGVCALYLADEDELLQRELRAEFPRASLRRDDQALRERATEVREYAAGKRKDVELTLDIIGTDFQREVWAALRKIPYGQTRSYRELAAMIGKPSATRAVASACARNKVSLIIPCHRVVRSDGSISGYRWDPDRKRRILALEQERG